MGTAYPASTVAMGIAAERRDRGRRFSEQTRLHFFLRVKRSDNHKWIMRTVMKKLCGA